MGSPVTLGWIVGNRGFFPDHLAKTGRDDRIDGYVGEGEFTDDPLDIFGGAGVVKISNLQKLLRYICENGFEHHVAANMSTVANAVQEATSKYLGWRVFSHR